MFSHSSILLIELLYQISLNEKILKQNIKETKKTTLIKNWR